IFQILKFSKALVPLIIQFLRLNLKLFHSNEILNKRLSKGTADDTILCQGLQSVVELHRNSKVLLLTGGLAQTDVSVQVSSDAIQSCSHSGSQHNVRVERTPALYRPSSVKKLAM
uniref:Uncharacterized protein n=1 Tax=Mola mola TaxID=94237 RepID=A0A3Q3X7E6_MOLML